MGYQGLIEVDHAHYGELVFVRRSGSSVVLVIVLSVFALGVPLIGQRISAFVPSPLPPNTSITCSPCSSSGVHSHPFLLARTARLRDH